MNLRSNYQKFRKHLETGGIFYAFWRGIKYSIFLIKKGRDRFKKITGRNIINKGRLKIVYSDCGINILWNDHEITKAPGLNAAINTLGMWADSTKADWQILEKGVDYFKFRVWFSNLPVTQIWSLNLEDEKTINWQIEIETEEDLYIDEKRVICLVSPLYKSWVNSYEQADLPQIRNWQDIPLSYTSSNIIGVRFSIEGTFIPSLYLEFQDNEFGDIFPFIQNTSYEINGRILGVRMLDSEVVKKYYLPGRYRFFSGKILLSENDDSLDKRMEELKQKSLRNIQGDDIEIKKNKHKLKVLLVNLPWQREGRWGVRAGSRWPHIKDKSEDNYLPFPFFLAYTTSLLRKHNIEASLIDAVAEQIPEDKFIEKIFKTDFDFLVAETSTPSFSDDLKILKKISSLGISIILCGPHIEIYQPKFLKEHPFINFVLYGEYENTLLNLVKSLSYNREPRDVGGLIYRDGYGINMNPPAPLVDLDTLPWPLRESLPIDKYLDNPGGIPTPSVQMLASRGCPFGCVFCLWPQVMYRGNKYRTRNIIDVIDEMEYLVNKMGFKSIYFDDDTFNIGKERMLKFCQEIKRRGLEKIPWAIMARADLMDEETLIQMKKAGLAAIKYGIESASQRLINNCGKNMDLKKVEKMILFTKSVGIKTHLTFTFGLPGETKSTIQETIDYALKLRPFSVQFSITTPFPGTTYFRQLDEKGLVINKNWDNYDGNFKSVIKLDSLTNKDLELAKRMAYLAWDKFSVTEVSLEEYWMRFRKSYKQGGLIFSLGKTFSYLREKNVGYLINRVKNNYLDILGIFNGRYAFKGPNTIQIDLTDYCNNDCIACWCNSPLLSKERLNKPKYMLPTKLVKDLIAKVSLMGTREIYFSGGGEPFMHPDILEIVQYAKKMGIACSINTNFTLIDKKVIYRLIDLKVDHLAVSVWSGTANIYKTLHPNKNEEDFYRIQNMLHFLNSRKDLYPYVKIYNVICNINYHQIKEMLRFAYETKSEFIEFTVVDTIPNATDKLLLSESQRKAILEQCDAIRREIVNYQNNHRPEILNFEHFIRRLSNLDAQQAKYDTQFIDSIPCYAGWLFARIMPNGDVNSCLKSHRFPIGNIHNQSFKKIWNSKKQMYFRKKTLKAAKDDPFFALIGNDPKCKIGCYKSCDDISRNISMHNKIQNISIYEKYLLKILGKTRLIKLILQYQNDRYK